MEGLAFMDKVRALEAARPKRPCVRLEGRPAAAPARLPIRRAS